MGLVALLAVGAAACSSATTSSGSSGTAPRASAYSLDVAAQREAYTNDAKSPVIHDTETNALVVQGSRLFAATDQWEYPGPDAYGQVLVKDRANGPWTVFEQTQGLRVQALDSFSIPSDQGLRGRSLLVTQAVLEGRSVVQWALDGAPAFALADSYPLSSASDDVRAFGAHEADGQWAVYAGVNPTGILRGVWSPSSHTLTFDPTPELSVPAGKPGVPAQKVTGFADCGGALYTTINTTLYRRNDGNLPSGAARWVPLYAESKAAAYNSGLRGITCVTHDGSPSLLVSTEGNGDVYRFDNLPGGQIDVPASARPGSGVTGLVPTLEFSPVPAIRQMLASTGTTVPPSGTGSVGYVIAAYNNGDFQSVDLDGKTRQVFGFEWGYVGSCPRTRTCGPVAFRAIHFDAHACFAIRTPSGSSQAYETHCLASPDFTPSGPVSSPIRAGQAFVSIRTIVPSPFGDGRLYYGGYDCNFNPADGTAWVGTSTLGAIHVGSTGKENP